MSCASLSDKCFDCMNNLSCIEDIISEKGMYVSTTFGFSMYPMLRDRRDTVIITPCSGRLKKYDIPLYKRDSRYVLHRIVKVLPDSYIIRGDNCMLSERGITDKDIIGVMTGFYRRDKQVNMNGRLYKSYILVSTATYPVRFIYYCLKSITVRFVKILKGFNKI